MAKRKHQPAVMTLEESCAQLDTIYGGRRPRPATDPGVELARAVIEYFGDEPIDKLLTSDIALRNFARAIVARAEAM